jgi:hypothetical protein
MGTIFRTATKQAILDLIGEHATPSRFGQLLSDDDADALAMRVVDLFEMTLELRARTGALSASEQPAASPVRESERPPALRRSAASASQTAVLPRRSWSEEAPSNAFPTTVHAAEFTEPRQGGRVPPPDSGKDAEDALSANLKLPRTRKPITESERQSFWRKR